MAVQQASSTVREPKTSQEKLSRQNLGQLSSICSLPFFLGPRPSSP